ncbi:transporter substrate-binding domain-containing protein [Streptomyces sp. JH34]|uniref:transporter substrate-binding domain-containing protein n=1 Tax=Streptomyces sp. JH34 TaxID=2793633 RepID=UPI0023F696AF|nr:transporter substrate-binding domain-containing protein [Streptomyces sp. JH34]MDF6021982.1 transporter substrate-binding domain-containing protein [Streptomyces sp. JH34]
MPVRRTLTAALATLTAAGTQDVIRPEGRKDTRINIGPDQNRIRGKKVETIAAQVPAAVSERGTLRLGASADASPPLGFYATDDRIRIGSETDLVTLIVDTPGLMPEFEQVSWENLFGGVDNSKSDGVLSDVTVTEERKEKYDVATYRLDNTAFEARKGSGWKVRGPADVAGKTVSVASGAGDGLQGKIAATTKRGSGPAEAYGAAIDHIIQDGSYAEVLKRRWGLSDEAVEKSEINPPGLPKTEN